MIKIFFHVCMMDKYSEIEREILDLIQNSGLRNNCELNMVFVGDTDKILPFDEMIENLNYIKGGSIKDFEYPTLHQVWRTSCESDENHQILYLHTKGVSRNNSNVEDWRKMMTYFNIEKWEDRVKDLESCDVVGCNLSKGRQQGLDATWFSGNFWWANSSYIKQLKDPNTWKSNRLMAEFWLGMGNGNFKSCHNSNIDHYKNPYPEKKYRNL
jgi:hypothetical protein